MYKFSEKSLERLNTCHPDLIRLFMEAIKDAPFDFMIVEGHRGKDAQEAAFNRHDSDLHYPNSKHNKDPSLAVDIAPCPYNLYKNDTKRFQFLRDYIYHCAFLLRIPIKPIITLKNGNKDYPHIELDLDRY